MTQGQPLISIYTQVYNTPEDYLRQCIESVLAQTYPNFEYIILDNGSTDGSAEILQEYAQQDTRIILTRVEPNVPGWRFSEIGIQALGTYFACIDSDDWWEHDYLERILSFLKQNHLDIALTGTIAHYDESGQSAILRKLDQPLVFTQTQFAQQYPKYWVYPSTVWASLISLKIIKETIDVTTLVQKRYAYGLDTMMMLRYLNKCQRIGIDSSALYHYRIRKNSVSYKYNPKRFEANLAYCDHIRAFLVNHHTFDAQKKEWLKRVYLNSVTESVRLALGAQNTLHEKLEVCGEIAAHPQTADSLQSDCKERTIFLDMLRQFATVAIQRGDEGDLGGLLPVLRLVCPQCGAHVSVELLKLCQKDAALQSLLLQDNLTSLALALGERIAQGRYVKQFDLPGILASLLPENPLSTIRDAKFYRTYPSLCAEVIKGNNINALDGMTEALMNRQVSYGVESYLQLYLTLAALEQQVPAFLFGKVQLAQFYFEQGNSAACKLVLDELEEMGMGEQEEVVSLKSLLEKE